MNRKKAIIGIICLILLVAVGFSFYSNTDFLTGAIKKIAVSKKTPAKTSTKTAKKAQPATVVKRQAAPEVKEVFPVMQPSPQQAAGTSASPASPQATATQSVSISEVAPALSFDQVQALNYYKTSSEEHKQMIDLLNQVLTAIRNQPSPYTVYQQIPVPTPAPAPAPAPAPEPVSAPVQRPAGLVGHWSFDEGSGNTAADSSGNGNHGTVLGEPAWVTGKVGKALYFDGRDDYINVGSSLSLQPNSFTFSSWFKFPNSECTDTQGVCTIYRWRLSGFSIGIANTEQIKVMVVNTDTMANYFSSPSAYNDGAWHHVALTFDNDIATLYVDGVYAASKTTGAIAYDIGSASIGREGDYDGGYFKGAIDEVMLWNKSLSAEEIAALYQNSTDLIAPADTLNNGLVGHWTFDEGSGNTAADSSGNNNYGIVGGQPAWVTGKAGGAISFDGTDDVVNVTTSNSLDTGTGDFSLALWVLNRETSDDWFSLLEKKQKQNNSEVGWELWFDFRKSEALLLRLNDGSAENDRTFYSTLAVSDILRDGNWHHIAVVVDFGNTVEFYLDGISQGTRDISAFTGSLNNVRPLLIGGDDSYINASMDDVRVYNRVLTPAEVVHLMR